MRRTQVNSMVSDILEKKFPNLSKDKKINIVNNVSKTIKRDYYILDLNLKSETIRRINREVYRGTIQNKSY